MPRLSDIWLIPPASSNVESETADVRAAARDLNQHIYVRNAPSERDFEAAFADFRAHRVDAVIVAADAFFLSRRTQLAALAVSHELPAICDVREHVLAGGLISYGTDRMDAYRQGGVYAGKVLKGEKPSDLPVMQSTKFELVINLRTARTLGIAVPPGLLARADEVIE